MNISGLVVRVRPDSFENVVRAIEERGLGEVPTHDGESKLVVVVEAEDTAAEMITYKTIEDIPGVLSVELAYTYSEEFDQAREYLDNSDPVPEALSDDVPIEKIRYGGDVRNWMRRYSSSGEEE
ncbi:chaperone NapD [Oceanithermus sp.]